MKIFVVDDDPSARLIALDSLKDFACEVREFGDGAGLLEAMDEEPDLILLDIEMPAMDGISACRSLRQDGNEHAQVIFISAHDDLETRLVAYDAGGSDFIVKPYFAEELHKKALVAKSRLDRHQDISQYAQYARQTAFTAMSSMGEMGVVLESLRGSFSCADAEQLAENALNALRQYGLQGLLQVRLAAGKQCFSSQGECTPLEMSILDHASGMERVFQFHDRLAVNYPALTLLAQGLPLDDPDRVGRLRDHLAVLAEGVEARAKAIENEQRRAAQSAGIVQAVAELTKTLAEVEQGQARIHTKIAAIDTKYLEDLVEAFVHLGLTEGQENWLADMAQQTHTKLNSLYDDERHFSKALRTVIGRLQKLAGA